MQEIKFMQQLQNHFSKIEKEMSEHAFRAILQQLQNYFFKIEKGTKEHAFRATLQQSLMPWKHEC
jgi:exonuclease V gamma subunit